MDQTEPTNSKQRNHATEIITSGNVWSAVWFLAWPTAINTLVQTAYTIINRAFVGRLPNATESLAAVGIGGTVLMIQFGIIIALSTGTSALVARFLGAQNYDDANEVTRQSLIMSVILGVFSGLPLIIWASPISRLMGAAAHVAPITADYTAIVSWSTVPLFVYIIIVSALRSTGDVRTPLYVGAVTLSINAILDWLLIFGIGPIPKMGVHGAAISTDVSRIAAVLLSLWFLKRSILGESLAHFKLHLGWSKRILNIGWPAAVQNLLWSTAFAGFLWLLSLPPAGGATAAQAALTVAMTIESLAFMPGLAYSMAATPLVGQNLGAGKPDRAEHSAWVATGQAVLIMSIVAIVLLTIPKQLALAFTNKSDVVPLIVSYLRINAISEPFLAIAMVLRGALQGAGETRVPMLITVGTLWIIRLPLAWFLDKYLGYGPLGAWIAMSATTMLSGILIAVWFKWGTWRSIQV